MICVDISFHQHCVEVVFIDRGNPNEESEDIKDVIRIRKSKKERQHNDQNKQDKRTTIDLQTIHIQLKNE